jgi:hypothetical protein
MKKELITAVTTIVPKKGSNVGKKMCLINGKHWSVVEPKADDTHIIVEEVTIKQKKYVNVIGFSRDTRLGINDKMELLQSVPSEYASALALLLK